MNNLPPGLRDNEIPGSRPLDWISERYPEHMSEDEVREAEAALQADHDHERREQNE